MTKARKWILMKYTNKVVPLTESTAPLDGDTILIEASAYEKAVSALRELKGFWTEESSTDESLTDSMDRADKIVADALKELGELE